MSTLAITSGCADDPAAGGSGSGDTIKVGILHSLSGTMAISEVTVKDAEQLAIDEINAAGGLLGKKIAPVIEDGASDWPTFAEKAQKLISQDKVATVFGGWTSASRKAMLPVFDRNKAMLWYPVQYEGLESSPYIFYTGATTNQQIVP
ncbi:MAG TPA: transporter substrate-binding protein, partial [Catenuloplanes sp.]